MSVQTTFSLDPRFVKTNPFQNTVAGKGITSVVFTYNKVGDPATSPAIASLVSGRWVAPAVLLDPNTNYEVLATVTNNSMSLASTKQTFNTGDSIQYRNAAYTVQGFVDGGFVPLAGARLRLLIPDQSDMLSEASDESGLVWLQRIPRLPNSTATYSYQIEKSGYTTATGTINNAYLDSGATWSITLVTP
jgi:hypothetical protein